MQELSTKIVYMNVKYKDKVMSLNDISFLRRKQLFYIFFIELLWKPTNTAHYSLFHCFLRLILSFPLL